MKIAVIGGIPDSLTRFRGELIREMIARGHEVHALAGSELPDVTAELTALGARFHRYPLARTGTSPREDLATLFALYRWFRRERPDIVLAYTAKPVIWGGLAARLAGIRGFHALITGLGQQFSRESTPARAERILVPLYRQALKRARRVIFQNRDDRQLFLDKQLVDDSQTALVDGSGVSLEDYPPAPLPPAPPMRVLMVARLLLAKGVRDYIAAARELRRRQLPIRLALVGFLENGPETIAADELEEWLNEDVIDFLGELPHVSEAMAQCHVYCLPSRYGEGVPRTILEAMAVGRAVVSTDNVGCRDAVIHGETGLLVPVGDGAALVEALATLCNDVDRCRQMGAAGRKRAESRYDVKIVNRKMLNLLGLEA